MPGCLLDVDLYNFASAHLDARHDLQALPPYATQPLPALHETEQSARDSALTSVLGNHPAAGERLECNVVTTDRAGFESARRTALRLCSAACSDFSRLPLMKAFSCRGDWPDCHRRQQGGVGPGWGAGVP